VLYLFGGDSNTISVNYSFYSYFDSGITGQYTYDDYLPPGDIVVYVGLPDGFSIAGIPEPSTWAMLLIGFAGIGFASRR
jgi:hypothetical protein